MLGAIGKTCGADFARIFSQRDVAEFYLLSAFLISRDGRYTHEYQLGHPSVVTVFEDKANLGAYQTLRMQLAEETTLCFGVHWAAVPMIPPEMKHEIADLWVTHGLVESTAEGLNFLR